MKVELWLDFSSKETFETYRSLMDVLEELEISSEIWFRSYPLNDRYLEAHACMHHAKKADQAIEVVEKLMLSKHRDHLDIEKKEQLIEILQDIIDTKTLEMVLAEGIYQDCIQANLENALAKKILDVPHIRLDDKINLSGYQSKETIKEAIFLALKQKSKFSHCEGEKCERKKA